MGLPRDGVSQACGKLKMGLATVRVAKYCTQHEIGIAMW